ncbi:DUF418 domain-containing protein [Macrococcus capreoli]|uniref:DUF418 domain-containing protein n=1 Tax=Macrococcus capreoli TaxID=2982690 RepID=UPI003EE73D52
MTKRIESIDVLRGLSIIGILFMNIVGFHMNEVYTAPLDYFSTPLEQWSYQLNIVFIHNSFYPIFAFLFGFGLAIMAENIAARGGNFIPVLYRRMIAMLIFGLLHGFFLFYGDILNVYAVLGALAILLLLLPNIVTLIVAAGLALLYLLTLLPTILAVMLHPNYFNTINFNFEGKQNEWLHIMTSGDYSKIVHLNQSFFYEGFAVINPDTTLSYILSIMPFVLLGMFVKRANILSAITQYKGTMLFLSIVFAILGIMIKYSVIAYRLNPIASDGFIYYGGVLLSVCYIIWVTLLCEYPIIKRGMHPFKLMGKMSFTLYIMQSVLMFIVFYVFRLYGQLTLIEVYGVAIIIVLFQIVFATIYFSKFKQGPLEWVWRKITYLK